MTDLVEGLQLVFAAQAYQRRTIVPGRVDLVISEAHGQTADFEVGIADLVAGKAAPMGITADVPVMSLAAGGFFMLMPSAAEDEGLGLVVDRAAGDWFGTRTPGAVDNINGLRSKVLHDLVMTPFAITAPEGAPSTWDHLVLGGPKGPAIEVALDGTVTITAQVASPGTSSVITMSPGGDITIAVGSGNSVNIGGVAAAALALAQKVIDAVDGAIIAAIAAALPIVPPAGDGGTAGFTAFQQVWDALKNAIAALKAKGE